MPGCKVTAATLFCSACYAHGRLVTAASIATGEALAAVHGPQTVAATLLNPPPAVVKAWAVAVTHDGTSQTEIPNSRLLYAGTTARAGETLPQANILTQGARRARHNLLRSRSGIVENTNKVSWGPAILTGAG